MVSGVSVQSDMLGNYGFVGELGEILVSRLFFSFEGVSLYHWSLRYHISTTPAVVVVVYLLTSCALLDVLEVRYLSPLSNTRQQSWVKLLSAETLASVAS